MCRESGREACSPIHVSHYSHLWVIFSDWITQISWPKTCSLCRGIIFMKTGNILGKYLADVVNICQQWTLSKGDCLNCVGGLHLISEKALRARLRFSQGGRNSASRLKHQLLPESFQAVGLPYGLKSCQPTQLHKPSPWNKSLVDRWQIDDGGGGGLEEQNSRGQPAHLASFKSKPPWLFYRRCASISAAPEAGD